MVEEHKTEVVAAVFASSLLLELIEVSSYSFLHSTPILSDIREAECLDFATLHSHLSLTFHEVHLDIFRDTLIFSLKEQDESLHR